MLTLRWSKAFVTVCVTQWSCPGMSSTTSAEKKNSISKTRELFGIHKKGQKLSSSNHLDLIIIATLYLIWSWDGILPTVRKSRDEFLEWLLFAGTSVLEAVEFFLEHPFPFLPLLLFGRAVFTTIDLNTILKWSQRFTKTPILYKLINNTVIRNKLCRD